MAVGLALTGVVGFLTTRSPELMKMLYAGPGVTLALVLGAFALSWYVQANVLKLSVTTATALYLVYCALIGMMISYIFIVYPVGTLLSAFAVTGGVFAGMSIYGYVTKRDLTGIGSYIVMGIMGLFAASLVNLFMANNTLSWVITYAVVALFIGLIAYQTQLLKNIAMELADSPAQASKYAIVGSLILYIAFINLFLAILRIMGNRR